MNEGPHRLDRLVHSAAMPAMAFLWGLAEATLFFIVPDVLLTLIGCRSLRAGFGACGAALLGALTGGVIMYTAGHTAPEASRALLARVPAIQQPLVEGVRRQVEERGVSAVLFGPTRGVPYKIYAVEWGARSGNLPVFLLISIPGRGIRFCLSVLLAAGAARLLGPWTRRRPTTEMFIWALFWVGFYAWYFSHFGW